MIEFMTPGGIRIRREAATSPQAYFESLRQAAPAIPKRFPGYGKTKSAEQIANEAGKKARNLANKLKRSQAGPKKGPSDDLCNKYARVKFKKKSR